MDLIINNNDLFSDHFVKTIDENLILEFMPDGELGMGGPISGTMFLKNLLTIENALSSYYYDNNLKYIGFFKILFDKNKKTKSILINLENKLISEHIINFGYYVFMNITNTNIDIVDYFNGSKIKLDISFKSLIKDLNI